MLCRRSIQGVSYLCRAFQFRSRFGALTPSRTPSNSNDGPLPAGWYVDGENEKKKRRRRGDVGEQEEEDKAVASCVKIAMAAKAQREKPRRVLPD